MKIAPKILFVIMALSLADTSVSAMNTRKRGPDGFNQDEYESEYESEYENESASPSRRRTVGGSSDYAVTTATLGVPFPPHIVLPQNSGMAQMDESEEEEEEDETTPMSGLTLGSAATVPVPSTALVVYPTTFQQNQLVNSTPSQSVADTEAELISLTQQSIAALNAGWINEATGDNILHRILDHHRCREILAHLLLNWHDLVSPLINRPNLAGLTPRQKAINLGIVQ